MSNEDLARDVVAKLCTDDPCVIVDVRSCGCCAVIAKALAGVRAEERAACYQVALDWAEKGGDGYDIAMAIRMRNP